MISSLLIANRGEIARRIIRTAWRLKVRTIAVYSEADAKALHVYEADAAVCIGAAPAAESYLCGEAILQAARAEGAEAIHPGYGFLSENAAFAEAVTAAGLVWVGPPPAAIRAMGLKDAAKRLMAEAGVPVTPGYLGEDQSEARLQAEADRIGYPVLIKAVAGGGGKGMRKVERGADFAGALESARREAKAAFGDERVLLETYVSRPRHIEVQVFGDSQGQVVHLFERDCSLQRRHQKVIEEAPAPAMADDVRAAVCGAAVTAAAAVGYVGAGTVEFIADASEGLRADRVWFMEMNTRLQVEHPVTEAVTGVDLVEWQLRVASGEPLPLAQDRIQLNGHAIEARLYAENPQAGFLPSTGPLRHFRLPADRVRIDGGVEEGGQITPFYDPMIAKLIAHAPGREAAAATLAQACAEVEVWPVKTNAGFLARCLSHPDFVAGAVDTGFIEARLEALVPPTEPSAKVLAAAAVAMMPEPDESEPSPWIALAGFRLNGPDRLCVWPTLDGRAIPVWGHGPAPDLTVARIGSGLVVFDAGQAFAFGGEEAGTAGDAGGDGVIRSPMPGRIVAVQARAGQAVERGAPLVTLEAMKMEHVLTAPFDGTVTELAAETGAQVSEGAVLARLDKQA
jgi:propionyl-CoA carboxylase alpha chain/3-methylcrotonyl-CoA carboxylase alpha subunit